MTVRVVTDSSADLSPALAGELGIEVVPLKVRFGDEELIDGVDLTPADFWARMRASHTIPQTAAPSPGDFERAFTKALDEGATGIVCVTISSNASASHRAAELAAEQFAGRCPVAVVDSLSVSAGLGNLCRAAARRAVEGDRVEAIAARLEQLRGAASLYGAVATLEYLRRGGRIGTAKALLGTALAIRPVLKAKQGTVDLTAMVRTRRRALAWMADRLDQDRPVESVTVFHGDASDVDAFVEMLAARAPGQPIDIAVMGPVLGTHVGPGTVGVAYFTTAG